MPTLRASSASWQRFQAAWLREDFRRRSTLGRWGGPPSLTDIDTRCRSQTGAEAEHCDVHSSASTTSDVDGSAADDIEHREDCPSLTPSSASPSSGRSRAGGALELALSRPWTDSPVWSNCIDRCPSISWSHCTDQERAPYDVHRSLYL